MTKYHRTYKNFRADVLDITKDLIKSKPWRDEPGQHAKFQTWLDSAATIYNIPTPRLTVVEDYASLEAIAPQAGDHDLIQMGWSVLTMLHNFRHYMHLHGYSPLGEEEQDALGWSCSLFYSVAPRTFRKAVRAGRVQGVTPADLLSRQTLDIIQALDEAGYIILSEEIAYNGWNEERRQQANQILSGVQTEG